MSNTKGLCGVTIWSVPGLEVEQVEEYNLIICPIWRINTLQLWAPVLLLLPKRGLYDQT